MSAGPAQGSPKRAELEPVLKQRSSWYSEQIGNLLLLPENYTRAFGDGPRHFEPWSSVKDDTRGRLSSRQI
ncbi:hypothetical protein TNCV_3040801 [Trichonephila clavipes]|nr:hypothetical protein TNCV_3040761 [Trichonephila clavipes]GFV70883.1 hypothetical protein TNCV_3040781 [Trichonephila clavipes]GFV70885.1 hypothetical protein TNCV_3040801 [Trichonephila clavipes]